MNRLAAAVAAALALAGCGDYSTEDLRFLAALPTREDLRVEVPADATPPGAQTACPIGSAEVWLRARPTSEQLNASVDWILALVDLVRRQPPSFRDADARGWGPFDDREHPGREVRVFIGREFPPELGGRPRHAYAFEARVKGTEPWRTVIGGTFTGASASRGSGELGVLFDVLRELGMADAGTPRGLLFVRYDRASEPRTIQLVLDQSGFGLEGFGYAHAGYADGSGTFDYAFRNERGDLLLVRTGFDAAGAGWAQAGFTTAGGLSGGFDQCWDAAACLVHVDDPANFSGVCQGAPCFAGARADCPAFPPPPF